MIVLSREDMDRPAVKILIVEDSAEDRYVFRRKLQSSEVCDFTIAEACTGNEGMLACSDFQPDCILLDYNLPDLNGVEFIARLQKEFAGAEPAIVMLTGLGSETLAVEALKAGAQDYLVKGLAHDRIFQAINNAIENVSQRRQLEAQAEHVQTLLRERESLILELEQRAEALAEVDRRKDVFLATLAHELRNPLAPIRSSMDILKYKYAGDSDVGEIRQVIERQVEHLTRLVNDLTDVARISSGKVELKPEVISLTEVISRAVEICGDLLDHNQHRIEVSSPQEEVLLNADPVRIVQILVNILANACKYTFHPGTIHLDAKAVEDSIIFTISDPGIGIDSSALSKIFDIFTQISPPHGQKQDGLGIGLSLAKQFAEMHGGKIFPESGGSGRGSTFTVSLPIVIQNADTDTAEKSKLPTTPVPVKRDLKILVVDDNVDAADTLEILFLTCGYNVIKAYNGADAIEAAQQHEPDIIIMDIGMPGMSGTEAICHIRKQTNGHAPLAIALTGWNMESTRRETSESGFNHHLVKPVNFEKLRDLISQC